MFEKTLLKNGATVLTVPLADTKAVTVLVMFPVGSRNEPKNLAGASHYLEHLMFKGTEQRKNTLILTREIDRLGAHYNAFTSKEYTGYYIKTDALYLSTACDILSDMLFHSLFDAKEMEREKTVIVEEIRMYKDNPVMNIDSVFEETLYRGCPLGRDVAGTEKSVAEMKRDETLEYKNKHYHPANMIVVVAGKLDTGADSLIEKYFGQEASGVCKRAGFLPAAVGPEGKKNRITIERKKTDQAQIMLGFPAFSHKEEKKSAIFSVLNTILGGSMSSRLFIQVRERRGLAYMVGSGLETFRDTGYAFVRAGLEVKNINKAVSVIRAEIEKIKDKGVTPKELKDAKTHIHGSTVLSLEDSGVLANWYAREALFFDKIKNPEERLAEISKVTNEEIISLAKEIFVFSKIRFAAIGEVDADSVNVL